MQIAFLPEKISSLVFDIDQTVYNHREYFESQTTLLVERFAEHDGVPLDDAMARVAKYRESHIDEKGRTPSLGNTMVAFGIPLETVARWREELFTPEDYLARDERLVDTISTLKNDYRIFSVTNNPASTGRRTLRVLGVEDMFEIIIGLDTAGVSKPSMTAYNMVSEQTGLPVTEMVSIGDRYEVDVELPVKNGMGGIVIESMEDIYSLPEVLKNNDK